MKKKSSKVCLIIAIICSILAIIFAITKEFSAFGGATVVALVSLTIWVSRQRKVNKAQNSNYSKELYNPKTSESLRNYDYPSNSAGNPNLPNITTQKTEKVENHRIAGTSFRQKEIESLGEENPIYEYSKKELVDEGFEDEKIYFYNFSPSSVELIEEPDNSYDPNAIKVLIDRVHVGYVKKGSCSHIKKLLHSGNIIKLDAEIHGGKYKYLYCEYDEDKEQDVYILEQEVSDYYITIEIKYLL